MALQAIFTYFAMAFYRSVSIVSADFILAVRPDFDQADLNWSPDEIYEAHLLRLFFTWHNPFGFAVDEIIYHEQKRIYDSGSDTQFYSPSLTNAILEIGAKYANRPHAAIPSGHTPAEFFTDRARILLEIEMDSPTMATVQTLLVLSACAAADAQDARGMLSPQIVSFSGPFQS